MNDMKSYFLYIWVFLISIMGSRYYCRSCKKGKLSSNKKTFFFLVITVPVILIQGFRYNVGTDYFSYVSLSEGFAHGNTEYVGWYINEPLFILVSKYAYLLGGNNKYFFFLVDAILMNTLLFFVFDYMKEEVSMPAIYFMYYTFCFPYFLNVERQGLAVIIVWFSIRYIVEKKPLKYIICIAVAFLFHNTAIIGLILYPAYYLLTLKKDRVTKLVLIIARSLIPILFGLSLAFLSRYIPVFSKYTKFINKSYDISTNVNWLYTIVMLLVLVPFIRIFRKKQVNIWWLVFLWLWQLSSYLLNIYIEWGFRMAFYFEIGIMFSYAFMIRQIKYRTNKIAFSCILLTFCLFHFTYKFYIRGNGEIFPYQMLFAIAGTP